jgi:DNA polymerase-3 subunit alpha
MSAIMSIEAGDNEKIARYIEELKKMNIPVLQPEVNLSFEDFGVIKKEDSGEERDQIRFGFKTIKNLGEAISEQIVRERKENGKYKDFEDFLTRNSKHKDLSKKSLEALALSGALDSLIDRNLVLANIESLLSFVKESRDHNPNQDSLFSLMESDSSNHLKLDNFEGKKIILKTGMSEDLEYTLPMTNREKLF